MAVGTTVNGGDRVGRGEGRSGVDLGGKREAQRPRGERGRVGERPEEAGGAGALILPVAGEVVRRGPAPVPTPVGGTGRASGRWARPAGPGVGPVGPGVQWGGLLLLLFFVLFSVLFCLFFYLFISFSVLFHLKVFRHFIKMCFLHHNCQCII